MKGLGLYFALVHSVLSCVFPVCLSLCGCAFSSFLLSLPLSFVAQFLLASEIVTEKIHEWNISHSENFSLSQH